MNGFDVVIGNPPYSAEARSIIYDQFVFKADQIAEKTSLIIPAGWTATGNNTRPLRQAILDRKLPAKFIEFIPEDDTGFTGVNVSGGYCILELEDGFNGKLRVGEKIIDLETVDVDVLPRDPRHVQVAKEVLQKADEFLSDRYVPNGLSGISSNLTLRKKGCNDVVCFKSPDQLRDPIRIFASKAKGFDLWVEAEHTRNRGGGFHKVVTPGASSGFGNIFTAGPSETYTASYIAFRCHSEKEADHLASYMGTHFAEFLLILRKPTYKTSGKTSRWIPLPDLTRRWTDEMLKSENPFDLSESALDTIYTIHE